MGAGVSSSSSKSSAHVKKPSVVTAGPNSNGKPAVLWDNGVFGKLRSTEHNPADRRGLARGVGIVVGPEGISRLADGQPYAPPPPQLHGKYRWLVEDLEHLNRWEPYNAESSERLESALRSNHNKCLVTYKKRSYTVDLTTMQQLPSHAIDNSTNSASAAGSVTSTSARTRAVKRVPLETYTDPISGAISEREVATTIVDPFDAADDENITSQAEGDVAPLQPRASAAENANFPQLRRTVLSHSQAVYTVAVTPPATQRATAGAPMALSAGRDGHLLEWGLSSNRLAVEYATGNVPLVLLTARYSPTGRFIVAGSDDKLARVYTVGTAAPQHELRGHTHKVYAADITGDETKVVTASMDSHVRTWSLQTGCCITAELCHRSHIFALALSQRQPELALSAGNDALLCVHDFRQRQSVVTRFAGHTRTLWGADIRSDEMQYASCGMDGTVRLWDPRNPAAPLHVLNNHLSAVHAVQYMPKGRGILSSGRDGYVFLSDTESGKAVWRAKAHATNVCRVVYSPDLQMIVTCAADASVNEWLWSGGEQW